VFPQEILQSLLQLDGSADISSHPAGAQQDHSEAVVNSTSLAGSSQEILLLVQSLCKSCTDQPGSTARTNVNIGDGASLELMDDFCYLGALLSMDRDADAAVKATKGVKYI